MPEVVPAGQIAVMHRIVVEEKGWVDESHFLHALNYCMLLPGPEAQQLAIYLGWLLHGYPGGVAAGALFVLPGFFVMLGLSLVYAVWHGGAAVGAIFFGLKTAVLAIVLHAVIRMGRRVLKSARSIVIALCAFLATFKYRTGTLPTLGAGAAAGLVWRLLLRR